MKGKTSPAVLESTDNESSLRIFGFSPKSLSTNHAETLSGYMWFIITQASAALGCVGAIHAYTFEFRKVWRKQTWIERIASIYLWGTAVAVDEIRSSMNFYWSRHGENRSSCRAPNCVYIKLIVFSPIPASPVLGGPQSRLRILPRVARLRRTHLQPTHGCRCVPPARAVFLPHWRWYSSLSST